MLQTTKEALAETLKKMLSNKTLESISIKDIVDECKISRQAFYYHFNDIYDLLELIYTNEAVKLVNDHKDYETWQEGYYHVLQYMLANKKFVQNTYRSIGRDYFENFIFNILYKMILEVVESQSTDLNVEQKNKEFIARFYSFAFIQIGFDWLKRGMLEEPKEIIDQIDVLTKGDIRKALTKYDK